MFGSDGFFVSFSGFFFRRTTLTWLHCSTFGFEGEPLLLAIDVELDLFGPDIDVGICCAQERPAQDERRLGVDFHVEYNEVDGNKEIPDFHRDILCYSRGIADHLIR